MSSSSSLLKKAATEGSAFSLIPDFSIELKLVNAGYSRIAGIDEAGRGALAGPLAVGICMFPAEMFISPPHELNQVDDSKKLTPTQREFCFKTVANMAEYYRTEFICHGEVDRFNVNGATGEAIRRIVDSMKIKPDILLIDGNMKFDLPVPSISIKSGDKKSLSIAAASIAAKFQRDLTMERLDTLFPCYGFSKHKGYGTSSHFKAICEMGASAIHRRSYEPIKSMNTRGE